MMAASTMALPALPCTPPIATGACPVVIPQRRWRRRMMRCASAADRSSGQSRGSGRGQGGGGSGGDGPEQAVKQLLQQQGLAKPVKQLMQQQREDPWYIGFQTNERTLEWEESAGIQMIKLYICQKTGKDVAWVNDRLRELVILLPDIVAKLGRVKADLVLALASDTQDVAQWLIELEAVLPGVDLSRLAARYPALLLEHTPAGVQAKVDALRDVMPKGVRVERLIEKEPVLLDVEIGAVLDEIRRLLPKQDAAEVLMRNPSVVLDMKAFKMGSSLQDTQ